MIKPGQEVYLQMRLSQQNSDFCEMYIGNTLRGQVPHLFPFPAPRATHV